MVYAPAVIIVLPGYRFTSDGMLDKGICFLGLLSSLFAIHLFRRSNARQIKKRLKKVENFIEWVAGVQAPLPIL